MVLKKKKKHKNDPRQLGSDKLSCVFWSREYEEKKKNKKILFLER